MADGKLSSKASNHSDTSSSSEDESEKENAVESLVLGRAKRATAGNRLSSLVEREHDDEIELLFAENEQEEDESFDEDEDEASDANIGGSSSDEEDKAGVKDGDELAGEKELLKQDRQEKRKRKARDMAKMPGITRKKVKIDPTAIRTVGPAPSRPKKKSERVSWVASAADAPTRISSRKQTIQNRQVVHQRLVQSEKQRMKVMRQMEEAQKRKDATKPEALTQAQRLEEAAKMERKNAKSLSRWEESEKKRAADEKAKLEALHNRQLSGPVLSWWSGLARWVNGKIGQLGVKAIRDSGNTEEPTKARENDGVSFSASITQAEPAALTCNTQTDEANQPNFNHYGSNQSAYPKYTQAFYGQPVHFATPQGPYGFLDGIHAYAALPVQQQQAEFTGTAEGGLVGSLMPGVPRPSQYPHDNPFAQAQTAPVIECTSRNLVALKNVDANAQRLPELQSSVLIKRQKTKPQKVTAEHCAITGQPAKFRDPKTGLPYDNAYAYKEIQRLCDGGSRWSSLLECYVGSATRAARGVPEGFWKAG